MESVQKSKDNKSVMQRTLSLGVDRDSKEVKAEQERLVGIMKTIDEEELTDTQKGILAKQRAEYNMKRESEAKGREKNAANIYGHIEEKHVGELGEWLKNKQKENHMTHDHKEIGHKNLDFSDLKLIKTQFHKKFEDFQRS